MPLYLLRFDEQFRHGDHRLCARVLSQDNRNSRDCRTIMLAQILRLSKDNLDGDSVTACAGSHGHQLNPVKHHHFPPVADRDT